MFLVPFGSGRELLIDIGQPSVIQQGAGISRLLFPMQLDPRDSIGAGVALSVSGHAWLGPSKMDYLGPWTTAEPVATHEGARSDATVVLPLSDEQLAVIEHIRAGADLNFWIETNIVLGYDPAALMPSRHRIAGRSEKCKTTSVCSAKRGVACWLSRPSGCRSRSLCRSRWTRAPPAGQGATCAKLSGS